MKRTSVVSFLVAAGGFYACKTPNTVSGVREGEGGNTEQTYAEIREAMAAAGCDSCHSDVDNAGLNQWALDTKTMTENLLSEEPPPRGSATGTYLPSAESIKGVHKAYPEYFKGYFTDDAAYKLFAKKIRAPGMKVDDALESGASKDELFGNLTKAMLKLAEQNSSAASLGCTTKISDELKSHIQQMESDGWATKLLTGTQNGRPFQMYGCNGTLDATQCLNDAARWPARTELLNTAAGVAGARMVQVAVVGDTSYWMRSSPDGRFVGNGGSGAHIDDLEKRIRFDIETKSYDPGFFPDNSGWTFHGSGAVFCSMSTLEAAAARGNRNTFEMGGVNWKRTTLDPKSAANKAFCLNDTGAPSDSETSGSNTISTYQSIAAAENSKAYVVTGSHNTDPGSVRSEQVSFSGNLSVYELQNANGTFRRISAEPTKFDLPNEGDYSLTASGRYLVGRVAGQRNGSGPSVQLGYRLRSLSRMMSQGANFSAAVDPSMSSVCLAGAGSKPMASLDERFLTFHQYTGTGNSGKADIFIIDLLNNGKVYQVTNVPAGYRALFPHFLANNMLYFLLHNNDSDDGVVVATDMAARIAQ